MASDNDRVNGRYEEATLYRESKAGVGLLITITLFMTGSEV